MVTGMVYLGFCCYYLLVILSFLPSVVLSMVTGMVYLGFSFYYPLIILSFFPVSHLAGPLQTEPWPKE